MNISHLSSVVPNSHHTTSPHSTKKQDKQEVGFESKTAPHNTFPHKYKPAVPKGALIEMARLQSTPPRNKRSTPSELEKILALPNQINSLSTIKNTAVKLIKKINSAERNLMISKNYLQTINTNKDKYFAGKPKKLKAFESLYKAEIKRLKSVRQDLEESRKHLNNVLHDRPNNSLNKRQRAPQMVPNAKIEFHKAWISDNGELPQRIADAQTTASQVINDMKSRYSTDFQLVARANVVDNFPDLSQFFVNPEDFKAMPQAIQNAINSVEDWEYNTSYSSASEWFNSTDYWADNIQSVASWADYLAKNKKGLVFPDGSMIVGMADEASFKALNLNTSNNRTDWNYAYGLIGTSADGVMDWLGISAQAGWNTNYIFNYDRGAKLLTQQVSNSRAFNGLDSHLLRFN